MNNIEEYLMEITEKEGIVDTVINHLPKLEDGQGYLSNIINISLQGKTKTGKNRNLNFVIKVAATNKKLRELTAIKDVFHGEIYMYESIFPAFREFEKQRGIANPFALVPKCYKTDEKTTPEILIFENLTQGGFKNWNRKLQLDCEHVKAVLKEYGKFHAVSFALRDQNPELFQELTRNFSNYLQIFLKTSRLFYAFTTKVKKLLRLLHLEEDSKIFKKYQEFLYKVDEKFEFLISDRDDFYVILHGDCWCNNMLFKYKDAKDSQPSEIRFIDFQLTRLASPAFDVVHFFYTSSSGEALKDYQAYQRIYYDSFSQHLKALGSDADKLFPFSTFQEHWKRYATFGLMFSSLEHHAVLSEDNEVVSFGQVIEEGSRIEDIFEYDIVNIDEYKHRMRAIVEHFVDNML